MDAKEEARSHLRCALRLELQAAAVLPQYEALKRELLLEAKTHRQYAEYFDVERQKEAA